MPPASRDDRCDLGDLVGSGVGVGWVDQRVGDAHRAVAPSPRPSIRRIVVQLPGGAVRPCASRRRTRAPCRRRGTTPTLGDTPPRAPSPRSQSPNRVQLRIRSIQPSGIIPRSGTAQLDRTALRRRRVALAHHLGGHALEQLRQRPAVDHKRPQRVAHDVDEPGADDLARGRPPSPAALAQRSGRGDRRDPVAGDGDVRPPARRTGAVDHGAAGDRAVDRRHCAGSRSCD